MNLETKIKEYPEPKVGIPYRIVKVEEVKMAFGNTLKISFQNQTDSKDCPSILAAYKDEVGKRSKLGSFIKLLGTETDKWIDVVIIFKHWEDKNREIAAAPIPDKL